MIDNKKVLAIIPARGGSKGIKKKNIKEIQGKPLIAYTIDAARQSEYIDKIVVSTEDEEIARIAENYHASVPFLRPKELATDEAKTIDCIMYTINRLASSNETYDILLLLQPTSPLRTSEDIDQALSQWMESGLKSMLSLSLVEDSPILIRSRKKNGELLKILHMSSDVRRQDMPEYYHVNGAVYGNYVGQLDEHTSFNDNEYGYVMERSHSVDIDEEIDIQILNYYLTK